MVVSSNENHPVLRELADHGWKVSRVGSGQAAVELIRRNLFKFIVIISTDAQMDVTETLFNLHDVNRDLPVVVLANHDEYTALAVELSGIDKLELLLATELSGFLQRIDTASRSVPRTVKH